MTDYIITATERFGSSQVETIVVQAQPEPQVVIVAENPVHIASKRFDQLLVGGQPDGRGTTFHVIHNLNAERPGRLVTLASGTKSEINIEIAIISPNEVEVKFGMPVPDGAYWLTLWQ